MSDIVTDESGQFFYVVIGGLSAEKIVKRDVSAAGQLHEGA